MTERQDRRSDLVRAAYNLIAEAGLEKLRTRDVAARVGMNIATLHYYFATKEAMIAAAAQYLVEQFAASYPPIEGGRHMSAPERLDREFANAQKYLMERNDIVVVMQEMLLRSRRDPTIERIVAPVLDTWRSGIERMITAGVTAGQFRAGTDPAAAAAVVTTAIAGAVFSNIDTGRLALVCDALTRWIDVDAEKQSVD